MWKKAAPNHSTLTDDDIHRGRCFFFSPFSHDVKAMDMAPKAVFIIIFAAFYLVECKPLRVSHVKGQDLALYQGPKNYYNDNNKILPSFIITSKPLISHGKDEYFKGTQLMWTVFRVCKHDVNSV